MLRLLWLLPLLGGISEAYEPFPDHVHNYCGLSREGRWPWNRRHSELTSEANEDLFRLVTEVDVRTVTPGKQYTMSLRALAPDVPISRFVITAVDDDDDESCGYGKLRSLSDSSEHINYNCDRFLLDRNEATTSDGLLEVPFTWEPPSCGCIQLRAQVLDSEDHLYTSDNDPIFGLSILSCVEGTSFEDEAIKRWKAVEREVEAEQLDRKHTLQAKHIDHAAENARRHCCRAGIDTRCTDCDEETLLHTCDDAQPSEEMFAKAEQQGMGHELCWDVFHDCCLDERSIVEFKHDTNIDKRRETNKMKKKQIKRAKRKVQKRKKEQELRKKEKEAKEKELEEIHAEQEGEREERRRRRKAENAAKKAAREQAS